MSCMSYPANTAGRFIHLLSCFAVRLVSLYCRVFSERPNCKALQAEGSSSETGRGVLQGEGGDAFSTVDDPHRDSALTASHAIAEVILLPAP